MIPMCGSLGAMCVSPVGCDGVWGIRCAVESLTLSLDRPHVRFRLRHDSRDPSDFSPNFFRPRPRKSGWCRGLWSSLSLSWAAFSKSSSKCHVRPANPKFSPHRELQAGRTNGARALNTRLRVPCFSAWKRRSIGCRGNAKDTDPHQATSISDAIRWMSAAAWSNTISGDKPAQCCSRREEGIAATSLLTPLNECSAEKLGRPPWEGGQKSG